MGFSADCEEFPGISGGFKISNAFQENSVRFCRASGSFRGVSGGN